MSPDPFFGRMPALAWSRSATHRLGAGVLGGATALSVFAAAGAARADNIDAASCSVADLSTALASANDGDVVRVPPGACTWTTTLTFTGGVTLEGGGAASITFGAGGGLSLKTKASAGMTLHGFAFHNGFVNGAYPIAIETSSAPFNAPFRLYDNTLEDDGSAGGPVTLLGVSGLGPGLIDHNSFTTTNGADEVVHLIGTGDPALTGGWTDDIAPGGPNMVFLENNVFTNLSPMFDTSAEESYYGARFVFRYNTLTFEANDVHQGGLGGRWAEIYDNTYHINGSAHPLAAFWQFRGGSGVVFENIAAEPPCCQDAAPSAQFGPDCPGSSDTCTGPYPIPTQVGTGIHEITNSPIYVWGNTSAIDGATQSIQESLTYTNGTEEGATPTSCTHPGNVCDVVVTDAAPVSWVKCESAADVAAGCPVTYTYASYTYPHPLDDLAASCVGAGCGASTTSAATGAGGASAATTTGAGATGGAATTATGPASSSGPGASASATGAGGGQAATTGGGGDAAIPGASDGGCGCLVAGSIGDASARTAALALIALAFARRRRRAAS
ncbi:MAG TPA: hypothetical protein VGM56_02490 [Byssovorax sp.]|jgi:hypothetical protein